LILTQSKRALSKAATREKILAAVRMLVGRHGFANLTTLDVAQQAGISHGAVFVHFPTREALLTASVDDFGERMGKRLHALAENHAELEERLMSHLSAIREEEAFYAAIVLERALLPQEAKDTFTAVQSMVSHHFAGCLGKSGAAESSHALLFNTWIALLHHYLANRDLFVKEGESVVDRWGETLAHHFVSLINKK
jgi:AcrR family transcriptional regulator